MYDHHTQDDDIGTLSGAIALIVKNDPSSTFRVLVSGSYQLIAVRFVGRDYISVTTLDGAEEFINLAHVATISDVTHKAGYEKVGARIALGRSE